MARKVIALLGEPIVIEEDKAAEAISPGHLLDYDGSGNLVKHATAGGKAARDFALERDEIGKGGVSTFVGFAGTIDYALNDVVKVGCFHMGQRVLAFIASGQNITKGNFMESAGNGKLRVFGSGVVLARAVESVNNSAGPGDARIRVEIV